MLGTRTVSARDEARLPPGGFNLRYKFSKGYPPDEESETSSTRPLIDTAKCHGDPNHGSTNPSGDPLPDRTLGASSGSDTSIMHTALVEPDVRDVLHYVRQAFEDGTVLDNLPLEAAVNPGAWKAWRAYRTQSSRASVLDLHPDHGSTSIDKPASLVSYVDEWNWDGVWQERVQDGVNASISDPVLYGSSILSTSDDPVSLCELCALQIC